MLPSFENIDSETLALVESLLPATAANFSRLIGTAATLKMVAEFGGTEYRFPRREFGSASERFDRLIKLIGRASALALSAEYTECEVYIPRCLKAMTALRNRKIIAEFNEIIRTNSARLAFGELARRHRLSNRAVEMIVNGKVNAVKNRGVTA